MKNNTEILVTVYCATYNQEKYIGKCLESLISQITDFNYEIIVKDDCSTDNTVEIIKQYEKKYPEKIKPIYCEENYFSKGKSSIAFKQVWQMKKGKYFAMCEGDDFWTDKNKLQEQVDFLEMHPEYVLCGHAAYYANEDGTLRSDRYFRIDDMSRDISIEEALCKWTMATNSLIYRSKARADIPTPFQGKCINGDYALVIYLALKGKIYFINKLMSAYRLNSDSSITKLFRSNKEKYKEARLEFISMLDRIDDYTNRKYSSIIQEYKRKCIFNLYISTLDLNNAKKIPELYKKLSIKCKIEIFCRRLYHYIIKFN